MTKLTRILAVAACSLTMGAGLMAAAGNAPRRQVHQQRRIAHGVASGQLTRAEAHRLERNAAAIHRSIVRDRIDGGGFTPRERVKAQHRLNQQGRAIYRQKHDGQRR
jgi:hypothetical protein